MREIKCQDCETALEHPPRTPRQDVLEAAGWSFSLDYYGDIYGETCPPCQEAINESYRRFLRQREAAQRKAGYWYQTSWHECPVCGAESCFTRERVYDRPKPDEWLERNEAIIWYCGCLE